MTSTGRLLAWILPGLLAWGGCAASNVLESSPDATGPLGGTTPAAPVQHDPTAVDGSLDRAAHLVRDAALKQGVPPAQAEQYAVWLSQADPQMRPYLQQLIYAQIYSGSKDTPEPTEPVELTSSVTSGMRVEQRERSPVATARAAASGTVTDSQPTVPEGQGHGRPSPTSLGDRQRYTTDLAARRADERGMLLEDQPGPERIMRPTEDTAIEVPERGEPRLSWRKEIKQTIRAVREELQDESLDDDTRTRLQAYLSLMNIVSEDLDEAMMSLEGIDQQQQEFWRQVIMGLAALLDSDELPKLRHRVDTVTTHFNDGIASLGTLGPLRLKNLAFCTKVNGFGDYVECDAYSLHAGDPVLLYVEVENFQVDEVVASESRSSLAFASSRRGSQSTTSSPTYETELHAHYEILDVDQRQIVSRTLPVDRNVCRNRRRDYFIPYMLYMPKEIAPGAYTLELTIEDKKGDKYGNAVIDLRIK